MTYGLAQGVSYCVAEGRGVALDLRRDRYFGLTAEQTRALTDLARGATAGRADPALASLLAQGLLVEGEGSGAPRPCTHVGPSRSVSEQAHGRAGATARDAAEVALVVVSTWLRLKTRPLAKVISWRLRHRRSPGGPAVDSAAEALALRFAAVRALVPIAPICLLDSLALGYFLARRGRHADVVFAVGVTPFEAHAWAQAGDCALNETVHRTAMLTPILVV